MTGKNEAQEAPADSTGMDLDTVIADARRVDEKALADQDVLFTGHPASQAPISDGGETEEAAEETDDDKHQPSPTTQTGAASETGAPDPGKADEQAGEDAAGKKTYRFKDHDAAEEGYHNLHKTYNKTKSELEELRAKEQKRSQTSDFAKAQADFDAELAKVARSERAAALKKINAMDEEAEDYDDQVAAAWADADLAINRFTREKTPRMPREESTAAAETGEEAGQGSEADESPDEHPNWVYAKEQAKAAGLNHDDPVFRHFGNTVSRVDADGRERSLEDMVAEVVKKTKDHYTAVRSRYDAEQKELAEAAARKAQLKNQPLGTSPAAPAPRGKGDAAPVKRMGIGDALSAANEERRL